MTEEVDDFQLACNPEFWTPVQPTVSIGGYSLVRLYESKLFWHYDHRFGTFAGCKKEDFNDGNPREMAIDELDNPNCLALSRYFVPETLVANRYSNDGSIPSYMLAVRRLTKPANERTAVFSVLPRCGGANSMFVMTAKTIEQYVWLLAGGNSIVFDYCARNKMGGTNLLQFIIEQLPLVPVGTNGTLNVLSSKSGVGWFLPRVLELTYTAWDLEAFAQDCGWLGPPFRWDEERRFQLRCELDAAFFHLYELNRNDSAYILDTFPIVKRKDEEKFGTYRTKDTIIFIYEEMAKAQQTGQAYRSRLPIPAADIRVTHEPRWPTGVRPNVEALFYFQCVLPLMLRLQPHGMDRNRLLLALELLTDANVRKTAVAANDLGKKWNEQFPKGHAFSDAVGVLLALLQDGTFHGVDQLKLDANAKIPSQDAWFALDAYAAVRLAMEASVEVVQRTESARADTVKKIIQLAA